MGLCIQHLSNQHRYAFFLFFGTTLKHTKASVRSTKTLEHVTRMRFLSTILRTYFGTWIVPGVFTFEHRAVTRPLLNRQLCDCLGIGILSTISMHTCSNLQLYRTNKIEWGAEKTTIVPDIRIGRAELSKMNRHESSGDTFASVNDWCSYPIWEIYKLLLICNNL